MERANFFNSHKLSCIIELIFFNLQFLCTVLQTILYTNLFDPLSFSLFKKLDCTFPEIESALKITIQEQQLLHVFHCLMFVDRKIVPGGSVRAQLNVYSILTKCARDDER